MSEQNSRVEASYDAVAGDYASHLCDELAGKPLDRWLLERVVGLAEGGPMVDAGCGPGHVTEFLGALGADVVGIDLSAGMVEEARRRYPDRSFEQGDIRALRAPEAGWAVIVAFYSLIHFETDELSAIVAGLRGGVRPGGHLLVACHAGEERRHQDEMWDHEVSLDFIFHPPDRLAAAIEQGGFIVTERIARSPYDGAEAETERVYVLAQAD